MVEEEYQGNCEFCGCSKDDNEHCRLKTGSPCHRVGPRLCSTCSVEIQEELILEFIDLLARE